MITANPSNWKKTFFLIWSGQAFSLLGSGLVGFALVWWLTQTTGSAAVLASATMASILPEVFLGPFAGALVDRLNRRIVMLVADAFIALATILLAALFAAGAVQLWYVFVLLFVRALGGVFHYNAMAASTSLMVPEAQLARVSGLNQTLRGLLNIATPPMGALLMTLLPIFGILMIDVVTALLAILPLLFVRIPQPERKDEGAVTPAVLLKDVRSGLRYVRAWPGLLAILVMAMLINFFYNPAGMLMPLVVKNHFQGGAWELSAVEAAWGFGLVAGGLTLSAWGGFKKKVYTSMIGLIGMGLGALLVGFAPAQALLMAVIGFGFAGYMNPITNGPLIAMLQARVAPQVQGRIFTLIGSASMAMMPLGTLLAAPVAERLGVQAWFVAAGIVTTLMGVAGFFLPLVKNFETDPVPPDPDAPETAAAPVPSLGAATIPLGQTLE